MSVRVAGVLAAILWGTAIGPAAAQGLADVARKEAERRDQIKAPGKVLTNADLPASATVAPSPAAPAEGSSSEKPAEGAAPAEGGAASAASDPKPAAAAPTDDEEGWRQKAATVNGAWNDARAQVRQLQALIDRLGLEMAATDKSIAARAAAERAEVRTQLGLAQAKELLASAARLALEQEARASGVPAAWIQ